MLADIRERDIAESWCLGDVVGYGAQPDACVQLVFENCTAKLAGNHDLAVLKALDISSFSPAAADAVYWTRENISDESLDLLGSLKPADESRDPAIYHASPRDPVWEYVLWPEQAGECMSKQTTRVAMVGHSHVALCFSSPEGDSDPDSARGAQAPGGTTIEISEGRWLLNPGSVGQPRDGDPRAAWLELDTETWSATYRRIPYEVDQAAEAIREAGLPEHLARRLYVGQ
ncbi:metallophosphoesterase family protein [soil metagenome]